MNLEVAGFELSSDLKGFLLPFHLNLGDLLGTRPIDSNHSQQHYHSSLSPSRILKQSLQLFQDGTLFNPTTRTLEPRRKSRVVCGPYTSYSYVLTDPWRCCSSPSPSPSPSSAQSPTCIFPLFSLPHELAEMILETVSSQSAGRERNLDLARLSRVNKVIQAIVRPLLYRDLCLDYGFRLSHAEKDSTLVIAQEHRQFIQTLRISFARHWENSTISTSTSYSDH